MAQHGRYTVVRKLANGGMAEIFLANQQGHQGFQKPVVLKRILGSISADPQFRNMLIDEAHISMGLTHSNIAQVLDLGLAGGRYFLVLELIDGWDLGHVLHRAKLAGWPLPPTLGIFIVAEVCRALAYAHARRGADGRPLGIVHRDISPNNVLISDHGEVKLTDFGIAKAMNKREQTGMGVVKGKVAFMSPEQGLGKPIDARSDLFSLGTLLYLMIVGVKPFDAPTDLETLLRVQHAEFKSPTVVRADLPADVVRIIQRAMQLAPGDRYPSADEMLVDLERALRADYGGVGQTELKQYLAELQRRDGVPSIAHAQPLVELPAPSTEHTSAATLLEGNAVVLGDAGDTPQGGAPDEKTALADLVTEGDQGPARLTRRSSADLHGPALVDTAVGFGVDGGASGRSSRRAQIHGHGHDLGHDLGHDQTPARAGRRAGVEELSLPEGAADDLPPARFRRSGRGGKGRGALPVLLLLGAVAVGGAFAGVHYLGWPPIVRSLIGDGRRSESPPAAASVAAPRRPAGAKDAPLLDGTHPGAARSTPPRVSADKLAVPPAGARPSAAAAAAASEDSGGSARPRVPDERPAPPDPSSKTSSATPGKSPSKNPNKALGKTLGATAPASGGRERKARSGAAARENSVFEESARRVRSLQGLEQYPPGTIQLTPPADLPPPAASPAAPTP